MKEVLPGYWMAGVPKDQRYFDLYGSENSLSLTWTEMTLTGKFRRKEIQLPPGQWEIVGVVAEIPESVVIEVFGEHDYPDGYKSAKANLADVARSHGFEPDQSILLNKKV